MTQHARFRGKAFHRKHSLQGRRRYTSVGPAWAGPSGFWTQYLRRFQRRLGEAHVCRQLLQTPETLPAKRGYRVCEDYTWRSEDQTTIWKRNSRIYLSYFLEELSGEGSKPISRFGNQFTGSYLKPWRFWTTPEVGGCQLIYILLPLSPRALPVQQRIQSNRVGIQGNGRWPLIGQMGCQLSSGPQIVVL